MIAQPPVLFVGISLGRWTSERFARGKGKVASGRDAEIATPRGAKCTARLAMMDLEFDGALGRQHIERDSFLYYSEGVSCARYPPCSVFLQHRLDRRHQGPRRLRR
jgi:hypothetical protein